MSTRSRIALGIAAFGILIGVAVDRWILVSPDFDSIYRIVLSRVVRTRAGEFISVALVRRDDTTYAPLPSGLQHTLEAAWSRRGVKLDLIIPTNQILPVHGEFERDGMKFKAFERYVDSKTQKGVRVFVIDSIRWLGKDEVLVSWSATHASLDGRGSTFRLKRTLGFWRVVEETHSWIS